MASHHCFKKNAANSLAEPLTILFNKSLVNGLFLKEWKISFLTPIFKAGSKQIISNYRPICKISVIPKIFEKIICDKILFVVREHISIFQHGFIPGRSTATNLAIFVNHIISNFESYSQTDIIFTDFAKAFDRVNHKILLHKLACLGFHSNLLKWIESYLTGRVQIVKIDTSFSDPIYVPSGVPQGSHIGPLLFLLFINDISDIFIHSKCLLYADDLKLYRKIESFHDCLLLQDDFERLSQWCDINSLHLNLSKCQVLTCSLKKIWINYRYNLNNVIIERISQKKDLGIILDDKLSFKPHIDHIISKSNSMLGFIKRNTREFSDLLTLKTIYF